MAWLYVPDLADSNLGCTLPWASNIELSVTSSGKPMQRPNSWRGWRTRPWTARLSGTISQPLKAEIGVTTWISSLRGTRASPSRLPENNLEQMTRGTYGRMFDELLTSLVRASSFWKTSVAICDWDSSKSQTTYDTWATALRQRSSERRKSAQAIGGSDCLLSDYWATTTAHDRTFTPRRVHHGEQLANQVRDWYTPMVPNGGRSVPKGTVEAKGQTAGGKRTVGLESQAKFWGLQAQARLWPTVRVTTNGGLGNHKRGFEKARLEDGAPAWSTPPDPTTPDGTTFSATTQSLPRLYRILRAVWASGLRHTLRLNPLFCEWLMGFPIGWTGSGSVETASYLSKQRSHLRRLLED